MQPLRLPSDDDGAKPVVRSASLMDAANLLLTNFTLPITAAVSPSRYFSNASLTGGNQSPSRLSIGGMNAFVAIPNYPINDEHRTLLDTLADIASMKSPINKKRVHIDDSSISYSIRNQSLSRNGSNETENANEGRIGRRPRAMSEPWVIDDSWVKTLQEAHHVVTMSKTGSNGDGAFPGISSENNMLNNSVNQTYPSAPQILNKYTATRYTTLSYNHSLIYSLMLTRSYNKNGRIGIYTREERNIIIQKFYEKRKRRVWKKKIRYHCRKNLADRRVRVKGRFVKGGVDAVSNATSTVPNETKDAEEEEDDDEEDEEVVQTTVNVDVIAVKSPNISRQNSMSSTAGVSQVILPSSLVSDSSEPPAKRVRRHSIAY